MTWGEVAVATQGWGNVELWSKLYYRENGFIKSERTTAPFVNNLHASTV